MDAAKRHSEYKWMATTQRESEAGLELLISTVLLLKEGQVVEYQSRTRNFFRNSWLESKLF